MRAGARFNGLLAAMVAASGCLRPPDPLELHPDVVSVAIMLEGGKREARLLAAHPHRDPNEPAPTVTVTLRGPGWTAAFSDTLELVECIPPNSGQGPARCLRAVLPEEVRAGATYEIEGTAPLGAFSGEVTMPAVPVLIEPGDSLHVPNPTDYEDHLIPVRYRIGSDVGTLLADAFDVFLTREDGTEWEVEGHYVGDFPVALEGAEADTFRIHYHERPLRFSLRLLGIGRHYTNFLENEGTFPLPQPWPSFGIEGEGVYGYFDGAVPSRVSRVWVQ
ncbi:MAG: hypothetical protein J4F34_00480 [Gemmatimonadetes bacterium]|nr:hypothetical protein [Gemmatimonadota bacterium]